MDDKLLFFNSETILNKGHMLEHFSRENKKFFAENNIEFGCKKGKHTKYNQDSFFCIVEGPIKFFGVFDGHGANGHVASALAMGCMVDYI